MRIYLDSCVFRDLKKPENEELLQNILVDKTRNVYCYSEAHLLDLTRDKTEKKFEDMDFMERIVDGNSLYHNKKIILHYVAPKDFYDPFPESPDILFDTEERFGGGPLIALAFSFLKLIPLNFKEMIAQAPQPIVIPERFRALIESPSNMYEFVIALGNFTNDLSSRQKNFRDLISYLHEQKAVAKLYEQMGVKGYDGESVTDATAFRESYQAYFQKDKQKDRYDLFLEMYNGLELFGFVKGKPKRQKLLNMVNDGRHAFYGAFCDIVVSSDTDFIAKTKFLYDVHDILTPVFTLEEFRNALKKMEEYSKLKLTDLIKEVGDVTEEQLIDVTEEAITYNLKSIHYSYFDTVSFLSSDHGKYWYVTSDNTNLLRGTLANEFDYVTGRLVSELGPDFDGKTAFNRDEIKTGEWAGRRWRLDDTILELSNHGKLFLTFFPIEYLRNVQKARSQDPINPDQT